MRPAFLLLLGLLATVSAAARPLVVASNTILHDLVREIAGDTLDHRSLVAPGVDPHHFEPRPADVRLLARADLLVVNGLGYESWLTQRLITQSGFRGTLVTASDGITPLESTCSTGHHHHHDHRDPHAWQDPRHVATYVANLRDALVLLAPDHAALYTERAAAYTEQLLALDAFARQHLASLPPERRKLVTSHDSLGYFGHAYDLTLIPISGLIPGQEPSARDLAQLIRLIRAENVSAIFIETTSNSKVPELIAREANVRVVGPLYTDSLGPPGSPGETYLAFFRHNLHLIVNALSP